ncbi:MAG: SRPBCC domain-containing protein [Acidimicrobiia bacterium]
MSVEDQPLADVLRDEDKWVLRYERVLRHPSEKVWAALTESEHLRHWMPCDMVGDRRAGADLKLPFWPAQVERYAIEEPVLHGKILVWNPYRVFEWTWDTDVLRWELEPVTVGTLLTLTTWLGKGADVATDAAAGYHVCLDQLIELLDRGIVGPLEDADVHRWEDRYTEAVAAAESGRR